MSLRRPEIFVSATSADLRSCRQLIKEGLLTLGCVPVEQGNFPPDYRRVRDMLRTRIAACDAVVHLAGECYGAEPAGGGRGEPRRSYTQLEYDLARELRKPLYVFLCEPGFAYDAHPPEDAEKRRLQQAHRAVLAAGDNLRCEVGSPADLALRIRELQTSVEHLTAELRKTRTWLGWGIAAGTAALVLGGAGWWWTNQRAARSEGRITRLETEFERQRRQTTAVVEAYRMLQVDFDKLQLSPAERRNQVFGAVATRQKQSVAEVQATVGAFIAAVRAKASAAPGDLALAEVAESSLRGPGPTAGADAAVPLPGPPPVPFRPLQSPSEPLPPSPAQPLPPGGGGRGMDSPVGGDLSATKERMARRISVMLELKNRGVTGEDRDGYLAAFSGATAVDQRLIAEENSDRRAVYAALAAQTRTSLEKVGQVRAKQLAGLAPRGHWIQDTAGEWIRKP